MRSFRTHKEAYIIERSARARTILHVGCTAAPDTEARWNAGTLLHKRLCSRRSDDQTIVGIDLDEESTAWLQERMPGADIRCADAHDLGSVFPDERFDLIIAGDVIEHLPNPGLFLEGCLTVLAPAGSILVSTANAFGIARFAKALLNHEAVHAEHTAYYSHATLTRLFQMTGLEVRELGYYRCKPLTRFSAVGAATNAIENTFAPLWPQFSEGIIGEVSRRSSSSAAPAGSA